MMVFITGPTKIWKFRETDRKDYQVYARYYDQCITCRKCEEGCPGEAITVSVAGMADAPAGDSMEAPSPE